MDMQTIQPHLDRIKAPVSTAKDHHVSKLLLDKFALGIMTVEVVQICAHLCLMLRMHSCFLCYSSPVKEIIEKVSYSRCGICEQTFIHCLDLSISLFMYTCVCISGHHQPSGGI